MSASVARLAGVESADLNFATATLLVAYDPRVVVEQRIVKTVVDTGHGLTSMEELEAGTVAGGSRRWIDRHLADLATIGSGAGTAAGFTLQLAGLDGMAATGAFALAVAMGGLLVWRRALVSLKTRMLDMNVLMSIAVAGAMVLGEWGEAATVFFLFTLGGMLEAKSLERTRRSIRDLMSLAPPVARVRRGAETHEVPVDSVARGETVLVRAGERVPLDGRVIEGRSAIDESAVTGESVPADKTVGARVFGGTLNITGLLAIEVTAPACDSTMARIVHLVEAAQASRAPSQTLVDAFSRWYTPLVIAMAASVALLPPLVASLLGADWGPLSEWVRRALVLLVVSCPCALVLSTPVSIVSAITRASRDGVLVKGGAFIEVAARVRAVAFDKTGTLTRGRPQVGSVVTSDALDRGSALGAAAALEVHSNHPIASAIVEAATEAGVAVQDATEHHEEPGVGVSGVIQGRLWRLCSPGCARQGDADALVGDLGDAVELAESRGETALVLLRGHEPVAVFGVEDELRPEAADAIAVLHAQGIAHTIMLTGDNETVAETVAARTGISSYLARLLPQDKIKAVETLKESFGTVAMVGDGVNDAPALAACDLGIAMGGGGTDTALDTADVALMRDDLRALAGLFALGRRTIATIRVNVAVSVVIKAIFLVAAAGGWATLWMAVFADTGVSLLVILNGMRLLKKRA